MKRFLYAAAATAVIVVGAALAASDADAKGLRLYDFKPGEFASTVTGGSAHYHLGYSLTNSGDEARKPGIRIELRTETEKTYGDHYHAPTFKAAAEAAGLDAPTKATSKIRSEDLAAGAAVDGMAHFGSVDPNADDLEVRVYGLWHPIVRTTKGVFSERRVLVLKYERKGDEYNRQDDPIRLVSTSEMLEGEPTLLYGGDE